MVLVLRSRALGPTLTAPAGELWPFRARFVRDARHRLSPASPFSFRAKFSANRFRANRIAHNLKAKYPRSFGGRLFPLLSSRRVKASHQYQYRGGDRRSRVRTPLAGARFFLFFSRPSGASAAEGLSRCGHQHAGSRGRHGHVAAAAAAARRGVRGSTGSTSSTSSTSSSSSSSSGHRWAGAAKDDAAIMGAASEALVLIRRLRGIRGTDAERYDAMQRVMETGLAAGGLGGDVRRPGRPPAARAADATSTGGRSSRKDGRHARGRERRHRVFALVTQGCFWLLAGCTMHALKASDTTTPAAFAEHCIASGFLAFAMRTLRSFAALPSAADTNPLAGMVVAVLQTTVLQEGVADRLLGQHLADHGSTPRELYGLLEGAIERGSEAPVCLQGVRLHTLGRVPGVAAAAAEGAAAASSGAIGGSSASVEAARAVA